MAVYYSTPFFVQLVKRLYYRLERLHIIHVWIRKRILYVLYELAYVRSWHEHGGLACLRIVVEERGQ